VIRNYFERKLSPFRISWPDGEVAHDLILAAPTADERASFVDAVNGVLKKLAAGAPTTGYLLKQKGRKGGMKLGWSKRWFVLTQPSETLAGDRVEASLKFFEEKDASKGEKGVVVLNEGTAVLTWRQKAQMLDLGAGGKGELHSLSIDCLPLSLSRLSHTPRLPAPGELHCLSINSIADGEDKPVITVLAAHTPGEIEKWAAAVKAALKPPNTGTSKSTKELSEEKELKAKPLKQLKNLLAYMEVSVDPRRADDKDFLVQTVVDHRQALRSAKAFSKKMKKELAERMDKDRQKLLLRSVDELKALLVYLEAEFDESIDDKEKLVRLVVNQKNAVGMAKRHAKTLLRWRERSRGESAQAGELPAVRESEVMPTILDDEAAGGPA
jgi:hypothetical protein